MKKLLAFSFVLFFTGANAQNIDSTRYYVTEARINNEDYSQHYYENGQYLKFYEDEDNDPCLLNSMNNQEEYSFGKIYGLKKESIEEEGFPAEKITFRWNYHNSYDEDTGYAFVELKRIYRVNGVEFSVKILTKKLEMIDFSGFTSERPEIPDEKENNFKKSGYLNAISL